MLYWPADAVSSIHGGQDDRSQRSVRRRPGKPVSKSIFSALSFSLRAKQSSPKEAAAIVRSTKKLR
jgi:hypothetical protein